MLQQVCEYIHNYFIKAVHEGRYEITAGVISLDFLKEGQRFRIKGSDLNDGVYTYYADGIRNDDDTEVVGLRDETFEGTVRAMAVPPAVIALSGEINEWVEKYGETVNSPYQSENVIGVYSYTKAQFGGSNNSNSSPVSWQDIFKSRLDRYRRMNFDDSD